MYVNHSNSVPLSFLFCSHVFISRSYKNRSKLKLKSVLGNHTVVHCMSYLQVQQRQRHGTLLFLMPLQGTTLWNQEACEFCQFHQEWQPQALNGKDSKLCIQFFQHLLHPTKST